VIYYTLMLQQTSCGFFRCDLCLLLLFACNEGSVYISVPANYDEQLCDRRPKQFHFLERTVHWRFSLLHADLARINSYYYSVFIYVCLCRLFMHKYAYATYFVSLSLLDAKYRFVFAVICNGHVDHPHSQWNIQCQLIDLFSLIFIFVVCKVYLMGFILHTD
jgi:hypothetical protein